MIAHAPGRVREHDVREEGGVQAAEREADREQRRVAAVLELADEQREAEEQE